MSSSSTNNYNLRPVPSKATTTIASEKKGILRSLSFQFTPFLSSSNKRSSIATPVDDNDVQQPSIGPMCGVQCVGGGMLKKYNRNSRKAKWKRRFFILKECFLLYYVARFERVFAKTKRIDLRPKGVIPLNGCSIVAGGDIGKKHCLLITHPQFDNPIIICTLDFKSQERWLLALREATKISYKNTLIGETLIKELESQGALMDEQKKAFLDKLHAEENALKEEIDKNMTLEKVKNELENEKTKLINMTHKLKSDLQQVKQELRITMEIKKTLEQEKLTLDAKTLHLVSSMETLEMEKTKIEEQMRSIACEREKFLIENQTLSTTTCNLKNRLSEIESKTALIASEKERIEQMLRLNEQKTNDLEDERHYYNQQTRELMANLKELNVQKEMTEAELKDEVIARIAAEKQLNAAERALEHLEMALKLSGAQMSELQEQIMPDVRKLREFFEECAKEARLDANKPIIMKNAVYARRSIIRRSKTRFLRSSIRRSSTTGRIFGSGTGLSVAADDKSGSSDGQENGWNTKECGGGGGDTMSSISYITEHL